jgi:hypothetical protein
MGDPVVTDWWLETGLGGAGEGCTAEAGGGCHGSSDSSELVGRTGHQAAS